MRAVSRCVHERAEAGDVRSESEDGRPAIRMPSERPSNSWWKTMAMTREAGGVREWGDWGGERREGSHGYVLNSEPVVMDRVSPMTSEWIMMPSWRTCIYGHGWGQHAAHESVDLRDSPGFR